MKSYAGIFNKPYSPFLSLKIAIIVVMALTALADWMFYGHYLGITYVLFLAALAIAAVLANPATIEKHDLTKGSIELSLALLPGIESLELLSSLIGLVGIATFTLVVNRKFHGDVLMCLRNMRRLFFQIFWRVPSDVYHYSKLIKRLRPEATGPNFFALWGLPIALGLGFAVLFAIANPLIENWLVKIDILKFLQILAQIDPMRLIFWAIMIAFCWPFIHFKLRKTVRAKSVENAASPRRVDNEAVIFRALLLFNLIFAIQTILDAAYLWGGVSLPAGISYASYAHRGAYTLIFTALLAAVFVLSATRQGSTSASSSRVKLLILLWIAQNVILVLSCVLRLDLYVEAFSLTYLRVAAFIWMGLVCTGLILIIAKIWFSRSAAWLIRTNLFALGLVLYASSIPNLAYIIADYNVSIVANNTNKRLDVVYLASLGIDALPAIDRALAPDFDTYRLQKYGKSGDAIKYLTDCRAQILARFEGSSKDWRSWSYRNVRLKRYLDRPVPKKIELPNEL